MPSNRLPMPANRKRPLLVLAALPFGLPLGLVALSAAPSRPAGAATTPADTAPWPMALHDARHTGTTTAAGPATGHLAWTRSLGDNITPGPVVGTDGTIYVATNAGILHALNPVTGQDIWTFNGGAALDGAEDLSVSPLILPSGDILWGGSNDTLFLVSPQGQSLWQHQFTGSLTSPVLSGSSVYVGTMDGKVVALNVSGPTPAVRWTLTIGASSFGSPVVAPNGDIVTTCDSNLVVVADHGTKGSVVWQHTFHGLIETSASVGSDGTIVVGTNDPFQYAFTPTGKIKWKVRRNTQSYSAPSVSPNGNAYFGGNTGHLQVVKTSTGKRVVTDNGIQGLWGAQVIDAHGNVYFGTQGHHIYGYTAKGHRLFDLTASGAIDSYPAMTANGTLVVGDESGTLYAIGG